MGCWAHVRRKFYDAVTSHVKGADTPLQLINEMFVLEREWQTFSPRVRRRRNRLRKLLKRFWQQLEQVTALPQSRLGKAVTYALGQRNSLDQIINDGVIDWSNSASERNMKTLAIGRKNWLFSTSPRGAKSTAIWMTLIESAKANHLDPHQYLIGMLKVFPTLPTFPKKEQLAAYLPWNYQRGNTTCSKNNDDMPRQATCIA